MGIGFGRKEPFSSVFSRSMPVPRRILPLIFGAVLLVVIACTTVSFRENSWRPEGLRVPFTEASEAFLRVDPAAGNGKTRIAFVETGGTHDEVAAALVHAFGEVPNAELGLFYRQQRYKMRDIMDNFTLSADIAFHKHENKFYETVRDWPPHIIVSTTCEFDAKRETSAWLSLLEHHDTHVFCFIHHADRWVKNQWVDVVKQFHARNRLDVVGLSQHTIEFFGNKSSPNWDNGWPVRTRVLPPVFPVQLPDLDPSAPLSLAMQGDYSSDRRDYNAIFGALDAVISTVQEAAAYSDADASTPAPFNTTTVDLHVIGHGSKPSVPAGVKDRVFFDESLSYPDFYGTLSRAFSILPSFANDEYYDRKASSTVPAALIAGAPLVANEKLLAAYTYLPREAAWVQREGESEMDVIRRVVAEQPRDVIAKRKASRDACNRLIRENQQNVNVWVSEALARRHEKPTGLAL